MAFGSIERNEMEYDIWEYGFLIPEGGLKYKKPISVVIFYTKGLLKKSKQTSSMSLADSIPLSE